MRFLFVLLSLFLGSALADDVQSPPVAAGPVATEMPRVVMARIGSREITVESFMQFLARHPKRVHDATTTEGKADLLRTLIGNELLLLAMEEEGLLPENPTDEDRLAAFAKLEEKHFPLPPAPDEEALRAYYQEHRSEFGIPASVRLTQIQFRVPEGASEADTAAVRERAEAALARVEAGESFAEVAGELTENPRAKASQGDVGFVWRHGDAWLEDALQGLAVGDHTAVLESPVGYDILMITDAREAIVTPFDEARDSVAMQIQTQMQKEARAAYVKELADRAGVEIVLEEMKGSYPNGVFP